MAGELFLLFILILLVTPLLGSYLEAVFTGKLTFLSRLENICYKIAGVDLICETSAFEYGKQLLYMNGIGFVFLFSILSFQHLLPLNPQQLDGVSWPLAFNITASFVTNTNWQSYAPETTLSYFSQMVGLTVQNFLSAAIGMGALLVLIRGIARKKCDTVGNFWQDLIRSLLYILLPFSFLFALFLISQGTIQNFLPYTASQSLEGVQTLTPMGPAASQIAIKQLGSNGGGFFNANSAHPFENPTALTNFFENVAILLIPAALIYMYGIMIGSKKRGALLFTIMGALFLTGIVISSLSENTVNPLFGTHDLLEGKETRLGTLNSLLWSTSTTCTSNGSVNAQLSSLSPIAGAVLLFNMMVEEVIFGGVGVGLSSMIMFIILTIFLSGLMVGRTPEYHGKKIERREIQWVMVATLTPSALVLIGTSLAIAIGAVAPAITNLGPHGLTELIYSFTSAAANNGSAFQGFNASTPFYNITLGIIMIISRLSILVPSLMIGDLLVKKRVVASSIGSFTTNNFLFAFLLISVILIVGALTFLPALALGPIIEQLLMLQGRAF